MGEVYLALVMALQKTAGHRVSFQQVLPQAEENLVQLVFEYEQINLVKTAMRLAATIVCIAAPELAWPEALGSPVEDLSGEVKTLRDLGRDTLFPADSEALMEAALARGIPCVKLERHPFQAEDSEQRVRRNSLLKFGHAAKQLVVDGMLNFDRSSGAFEIFHDRKKLQELSEKYRFIVPFNENKYRNINTFNEARDAADAIGYPVVLKPRRRSHGKRVIPQIRDSKQLAQAFKRVRGEGGEFIIESHVAGTVHEILVANHQVMAVLDAQGRNVMEQAAETTLDLAVTISQGESVGLLSLTVVTPDIGQSLIAGGGAVIDVDPSPRLDVLLGPGSTMLARAVDAFLDWLYPDSEVASIPVLAITGTNGENDHDPHVGPLVHRNRQNCGHELYWRSVHPQRFRGDSTGLATRLPAGVTGRSAGRSPGGRVLFWPDSTPGFRLAAMRHCCDHQCDAGSHWPVWCRYADRNGGGQAVGRRAR